MARLYIRISPLYPFDQKTKGSRIETFNKKLHRASYIRIFIITQLHMFKKLFKRKTELEKLHEQHATLLEKAFKASKVNRTLSDELMAQAYAIEQKIFKETNK